MAPRDPAPVPPQVRRHDRVWLAAHWREALAFPLPAAEAPVVADWIAAGRPLVAARPVSTDPEDGIRLGLALPGRRRVGLVVEAGAIGAVAPPLTLDAAAALAPASWRGPLRDLAAQLDAAGLGPRVFGSLAWHALACDGMEGRDTGYLTAASDVDLLLFPADAAACIAAGRLLEGFGTAHPAPRLDGEFVLPDGGAAAWREVLAGPERVLVKHLRSLALRSTAELFVTSGQEAA
ncbi:malonate decarboxylase holo-[acyl-carrier-protein] synthase [Xanthobacter oligotrophicus]|uniref:malonate decarboxylase holo-[acyl-carrier-protein] synthase n=1 Tax=Xanthobacter oligotrophicus TaxID=2607286 RepID=UPI0011F3B590|nr:malonate decarboxylase holo-[acyl-carrier-protein] synthase [Xanthobacter oligotrophicus]MCG5236562.1 malonate decarboxylase holo-[acyl-carrier-protein] synthase [Xanthobacter oligotrophicus]